MSLFTVVTVAAALVSVWVLVAVLALALAKAAALGDRQLEEALRMQRRGPDPNAVPQTNLTDKQRPVC